MNLIKRVKNLYDLSRYKPSDQSAAYKETDDGKSVPLFTIEEDIPIGDGKAEFLGEGTEEEFKQMENEDKGLGGVFGL